MNTKNSKWLNAITIHITHIYLCALCGTKAAYCHLDDSQITNLLSEMREIIQKVREMNVVPQFGNSILYGYAH